MKHCFEPCVWPARTGGNHSGSLFLVSFLTPSPPTVSPRAYDSFLGHFVHYHYLCGCRFSVNPTQGWEPVPGSPSDAHIHRCSFLLCTTAWYFHITYIPLPDTVSHPQISYSKHHANKLHCIVYEQ